MTRALLAAMLLAVPALVGCGSSAEPEVTVVKAADDRAPPGKGKVKGGR